MNRDHVKGGLDEAKGKVKENVGRALGDTRTQAEGLGDRIKGKVEKGIGDVRDKVDEGADRVLDRDTDTPSPHRRTA